MGHVMKQIVEKDDERERVRERGGGVSRKKGKLMKEKRTYTC